MKEIWKFSFNPTELATVSIPKGAQVLSAGVQGVMLCIWAEVDIGADRVLHGFAIRGTGHPTDNLPSDARFLNTVFMEEGALVFHVFDLGEATARQHPT